MQFLSLSYYPAHGFIYTTSAAGEPSAGEASQNQTILAPDAGNSAGAQAPQAQPRETSGTSTPQPAGDRSPMVMTTVPLPSYTTLFQHFVYACQPFWCHRHTHTVPGGVVYDIGDFRVRLGDIRQTQPNARVRGTVVEVEWRGPSLVSSILAQSTSKSPAPSDPEAQYNDADSGIEMSASDISGADIDAEYVATASLIREFWGRLGIDGAREAILVPDLGREIKERLGKWKKQETECRVDDGMESRGKQEADPDPQAGVDEARQFMEILRFNR